MATPSEVKSGLDVISNTITAQRAVMTKAKANAQAAADALNALATNYADVVATINGYGTSDPFEAVSKAELAAMTTEFSALVGKAQTVAALDLNS